MGLKIKGDNKLPLWPGVIIPQKLHYLRQSSSVSVILMQTRFFIFFLFALGRKEANKVIKYSIPTRKWSELNVQLCRRENVAFELCVRMRGHSLTRPPTVAYMERMLFMQKDFLRSCIGARRPEGHKKMTHCCHSSKNTDLFSRVEEPNYRHALVEFQMSIFGCFKRLELGSATKVRSDMHLAALWHLRDGNSNSGSIFWQRRHTDGNAHPTPEITCACQASGELCATTPPFFLSALHA